MKNLKYIILILFVFNISSCDLDLLDTIPTDRITTDIFWQSEKDAIGASTAIYNYLYSQWKINLGRITDEAHCHNGLSNEGYMEAGIIDAENPSTIASVWANYYTGIAAANYFLDNVDKIKTDNPTIVVRLKGEIRTLRAYCYMDLAFFYGDVPLVLKVLSIEEGREVTRTPVTQIWDFIEEELTAAAEDLPLKQDDVGRITKGAALALKARAMSWCGRFQECVDAAEEVMGLGVYDLYPSFQDLFTYDAQNNIEVILDEQFIKTIRPNGIYNLFAPYSLGNPSDGPMVAIKQILDAFEMKNGKRIDEPDSGYDPYNPKDNRDPRLFYSLITLRDTLLNGNIFNPTPGSGTADELDVYSGSTLTGLLPKKYVNIEDLGTNGNGGCNIIIIRYADILLLYAEAKIELNQIDQSVYDAINKVRQRPDVNQPPIINDGKSQDQLREIVRHERYVELAFEGIRFFDIRRWKIVEDVFLIPIKGYTFVIGGNLWTAIDPSFIRYFDPAKHYLWPIPKKERDLNKNLTQNFGY